MSDTNRDFDRQNRQDDRQEKPGLSVGARVLVGLAFLFVGFLVRLLRGNNPGRPANSPDDPRESDTLADTLPEGQIDPEDLEAGYETDAISVRAALFAIIVLVVLTGLAVAAVTGLQVILTGSPLDFSPPAAGVGDPPRTPVPDRVQSRAASGLEYAELRAVEEALLNSYGWVDESAGVVRIPIDRAMELVIQRGLPTRPDSEGLRDLGLEIPLDSSSGRAPDQVYDYWREE